MRFDDRRQKAFDFAQETTKQLITLATGIFALTITFLKDVATTPKAKNAIVFLHWGWGLYIVSVAFGVFTLMTLAGNLQEPQDSDTPSIYSANIVVMAGAQILTFFAALILTSIYGIKAI